MRQYGEIARERDTMGVIVELTNAFEGIASMHISQIKDQVLASENFFAELWQIYRQIRVGEQFHFGRGQNQPNKLINKELMILITAEGSFSGDIDQRLIEKAMGEFNQQKNDILVIGHHGAVQLAQRGVPYIKNFKLPDSDRDFDVSPIISEVQKYVSTKAYYPSYNSLTNQEIKVIGLSTEVAEKGKAVTENEEVISEDNYIFEPSTHAVVDHLERSMLQIMVSQIILQAKLAQYASRFRAMSSARSRADDSFADLTLQYNHARRQYKDERLKEIVNGLRRVAK